MDSDAAKARYLRAIGHDMRQPLHALLLYLTALQRRVPDGEARTILDKAEQSALALAGMFDNLVELARIDAGRVEPQIGDVPLREIFDAAAEREPQSTAETTALSVRSDAVLLDQILRHLISNAVKHGGGSAQLSAREHKGVVEISVSDAGAGIPPEHHERIFEEFERLEGAAPDGLGLGLTVARRLARQLNHEIELRSAPGKGATFIVRASRA